MATKCEGNVGWFTDGEIVSLSKATLKPKTTSLQQTPREYIHTHMHTYMHVHNQTCIHVSKTQGHIRDTLLQTGQNVMI